MYYIDDYKKKLEEDNFKYIADTIIDKIIKNIEYDGNYQINYMLTGYNDKIGRILNILNYKARQ